jgi:hypothetical protein
MLRSGVAMKSSKNSFQLVLLFVLSSIPVPQFQNATLLDLYFLMLAFSSIPLSWTNPVLKKIILFGSIWSIAQIAIDINKNLAIPQIPQVIGLQIVIYASGFYWLYIRKKISVLKMAIAVFGGSTAQLIFSSSLELNNPWKFDLMIPGTFFLLYLAQNKIGRTSGKLVIFSFLVFLNLLSDSRSGIFLTLITFLFVLFQERSTGRNVIKIGFLSVATLFILISIYPSLATQGLLGERAQALQEQSSGSKFAFIPQARPEFIQALIITSKSPLLGIGSYGVVDPTISNESLQILNNNFANLNLNQIRYLTYSRGVYVGYSNHSQMGSSLLFAGIFSIPFFGYLLFTIVKLFGRGFRGRSQVTPPVIWLLNAISWELFFSPVTSLTKVYISISILFCAVLLSEIAGRETAA